MWWIMKKVCLFFVYISPYEYLMHLLVAHTTSKTLLNLVHMIVLWCFCSLPKLNFLKCLMHLWGVRKEKSEEFDKVDLFFEKFDFENHLKSWTCMPYHKNYFSNDFAEKVFQIFQKFVFLWNSTDWAYSSNNRNVKEKNWIFF